MKFKVGQKVRIRKDSRFYGDGPNNPKDTNGIISKMEDITYSNLNIRVVWDNGTKNSYNKNDLEYWYKQPLRELLQEIKDCDTLPKSAYKNIKVVSKWFNDDSSGYLEGDELEPLRRLWEKWQKSKHNKKNI